MRSMALVLTRQQGQGVGGFQREAGALRQFDYFVHAEARRIETVVPGDTHVDRG